jgi:hypothetical protein
MTMRKLLLEFTLACLTTSGTRAANAPVANRGPLQPNAFNPLPLGSVMPK